MENKKEMRVYIVSYDTMIESFGEDITKFQDVDDETFMQLAEDEGNVFSLSGFQKCWNENSEYMFEPDYSYLRFIEV